MHCKWLCTLTFNVVPYWNIIFTWKQTHWLCSNSEQVSLVFLQGIHTKIHFFLLRLVLNETSSGQHFNYCLAAVGMATLHSLITVWLENQTLYLASWMYCLSLVQHTIDHKRYLTLREWRETWIHGVSVWLWLTTTGIPSYFCFQKVCYAVFML